MNRHSFQLIDGTRLSAEICQSIHTQLFCLSDPPRQVARRNGIRDAEAVQIALEVERELSDRRAILAFNAGRSSLLAPPPIGRAA